MVTSDELQNLLAVDSKIFFHDNFLGSEHISTAVTGSGEATVGARSLLLQTQLLANSEAKAYYTSPLYNPRYSRLLVRVRFSSMSDVFAYFGLKLNSTDPSWQMTESNAGFMLHDGKLYAVSGDSGDPAANYKTVVIRDIDCTRDLLFEVIGYKFRWYSIPYLTAYFDEMIEPALEKVRFRKW